MLLAANQGETTLEAGLRRQGAILTNLGVDIDQIAFGGGAGGSRSDLVSPMATVKLLRSMATQSCFPAYEAALPILGRDGTLAQSVSADSPARGHVRAKTGTYYVENGLNGRSILTSKALAGYMETASERPLTLAFFVNNLPMKASSDNVSDATASAGKLLGRLCEVFYDDKPVTSAR
jgi:D-alanyl-D-alanine carboxypeptidase/D-alanyl-D-alanine-endopeptidase (penicillin-binding protein 4)